MPYSLYRDRDGAGDSGQMSTIMRRCSISGEIEYEHAAKPKVGYAIKVGSTYARSFTQQDFWQTTYITEIIEDGIRYDEHGKAYNYVAFKTGNSQYEWKHF